MRAPAYMWRLIMATTLHRDDNWRGTTVSRAINLNLPETKVLAVCEESLVMVSASEQLPSGGTHLVCVTGEGAGTIRRLLKDHIILGVVRRYPFYKARGPH